MNIEQFKLECKRTCPSLEGGLAVDLAHMVLGMNTEIIELKDAIRKEDDVNIGEELADFYWYYCNYLTFRGLSIPFVGDSINLIYANVTLDSSVTYLYDLMSELQDFSKKFLAYGKEIDREAEEHLLELIYIVLHRIAILSETHLGDALDKNIAKLKLRFPDKFDADMAINRDVEAERKVLEDDSK